MTRLRISPMASCDARFGAHGAAYSRSMTVAGPRWCCVAFRTVYGIYIYHTSPPFALGLLFLAERGTARRDQSSPLACGLST